MSDYVYYLNYKLKRYAIYRVVMHPFLKHISSFIIMKNNKIYRKYGTELLIHLKRVMDNNNLFFWLDFGTLLGAYREHDFISHDSDIDIAMFLEDSPRVRSVLEENGFKLLVKYTKVNDLNALEETYVYKNVLIDIFYYVKKDDTIYCTFYSSIMNSREFSIRKLLFDKIKKTRTKVFKIVKPFSGFDTIEFKGNIFNIPSNIEEYLMADYGENFMIPNSSFTLEDRPNVECFNINDDEGIKECF